MDKNREMNVLLSQLSMRGILVGGTDVKIQVFLTRIIIGLF